ncbi:hypothetical protein L1987_59413 [Smallanthus sonchifolius]|uniref:Uncharacterized protein n=1 Tax=Smallanthus sonchifolius TaxID=185202 RepID=A0ACB9D581_9ASTR|nr:hypothetical protein L1987_59413 [Smallanthus sonchifolius]
MVVQSMDIIVCVCVCSAHNVEVMEGQLMLLPKAMGVFQDGYSCEDNGCVWERNVVFVAKTVGKEPPEFLVMYTSCCKTRDAVNITTYAKVVGCKGAVDKSVLRVVSVTN